MLVLLLLGSVVCMASVPPVDDPDTAIDESQMQVNLAGPATLDNTSVHCVADSSDQPRLALSSNGRETNIFLDGLKLTGKVAYPHAILKFLCTFLI